MKAAKRFHWEAAHRLPKHAGECRYLHGHSYRMTVELEGDVTVETGILIDFKDVKAALQPLIQQWDHATLIAESDVELREALSPLDTKVYVLPYDTTAENMCRYVADYLIETSMGVLRSHNVSSIVVRLHETDSCYAELRVPVGSAPRMEVRLGTLRKVTTKRKVTPLSRKP